MSRHLILGIKNLSDSRPQSFTYIHFVIELSPVRQALKLSHSSARLTRGSLMSNSVCSASRILTSILTIASIDSVLVLSCFSTIYSSFNTVCILCHLYPELHHPRAIIPRHSIPEPSSRGTLSQVTSLVYTHIVLEPLIRGKRDERSDKSP
jgi:hypothetical protein